MSNRARLIRGTHHSKGFRVSLSGRPAPRDGRDPAGLDGGAARRMLGVHPEAGGDSYNFDLKASGTLTAVRALIFTCPHLWLVRTTRWAPLP